MAVWDASTQKAELGGLTPPAETFACGLPFFFESIDSNLGKIGIDEQTNDNQVKGPRENIS